MTYRLLVRNHGPKAAGPLDVYLDVPAGARLGTCWVGMEGLGRCARDGKRLTWTVPRVAGGKTTGGPFVAVVDVSGLKAGPLPAAASVELGAALVQDLTLQKE